MRLSASRAVLGVPTRLRMRGPAIRRAPNANSKQRVRRAVATASANTMQPLFSLTQPHLTLLKMSVMSYKTKEKSIAIPLTGML